VKIGENRVTNGQTFHSVLVCVCLSASVCVIYVLGNNTEGESERLHRPH